MASERVLADTSLFIEHLRARDKSSTSLFLLTQKVRVETCAIVAAEVFYGARNRVSLSQAASVLRPFRVHPFTVEMAARQGPLVCQLKEENAVIDIRDLMIAASALELVIPVATLNRKHFDRIPHLRIAPLPQV